MSFVGNIGRNFFTVLVTVGVIAFGLYVIMSFKEWGGDWTGYFLRRGKWEEIIFVSLIAMAVTMVVMQLIKWHIRAQGRRR